MPTQEERIIALEQAATASRKFQQQVLVNIREIQENSSILLGVVHDQGLDIKLIKKRLDGMDTRLDEMDKRFDGIDARLDGMDARLDGMDKRFDVLETTVRDHTPRLERIESTLGQILERFPQLERMEGMLGQILERLPEAEFEYNSDHTSSC
jgi:archaellum component FlaC